MMQILVHFLRIYHSTNLKPFLCHAMEQIQSHYFLHLIKSTGFLKSRYVTLSPLLTKLLHKIGDIGFEEMQIYMQ